MGLSSTFRGIASTVSSIGKRGARGTAKAAENSTSAKKLLEGSDLGSAIKKGPDGTAKGKSISGSAAKTLAGIAATATALAVANKLYKDMKKSELKCNAACLPDGWEAYAYAKDGPEKEELKKKLEFHTKGDPVCTAEFVTDTCGDFCMQECKKAAESKNILTAAMSGIADILPFGSNMMSNILKGVAWVGGILLVVMSVVVTIWAARKLSPQVTSTSNESGTNNAGARSRANVGNRNLKNTTRNNKMNQRI